MRMSQSAKIWHYCHIQSGAVIGEGCSLGQNVNISNNVKVGDGVKIQNNVSVYEGVTIEDYVFCGPSCVFTNDLTPRARYPKNRQYKKTIIRHDATLGANCTIVCGHTVGHHVTIAAGAEVTSDVLPHALMAGVPARQIGWVCECGQVLRAKEEKTYACPDCRREFFMYEGKLYQKMCIYYGNKEYLTYNSQEHVLPAALGCHTKLPKGVVSDQANAYFSPIERHVIEQSLIQLPRLFIGPGKRGSLSPNKATKSELSVIDMNGEKSLGYIQLGDAYLVNHFIINRGDLDNGEKISHIQYSQGNETEIPEDKEECKKLYIEGLNSLKSQLRKWKDMQTYVRIGDGNERVLITFFKDKVYIGADEDLTNDEIKTLKDTLNQDFMFGGSKGNVAHPKITIEIKHGLADVEKVAAKSAMNTLAYLQDEDFVRDCLNLNELREKMFADDDSILDVVDEIHDARYLKRRFCLDDDIMACILCNHDCKLKGYVFFYSRCYVVTMCPKSLSGFAKEDGIVCDWKNQKDYRYQEFIQRMMEGDRKAD